jgi:hypothetical protein
MSRNLLKSKPKNMPCLIYDINQEYKDFYAEDFEDFDIFLAKLSDETVKHHYIIIEEATIFFNTQSNFQDMKNVLVRARHTGNIIQLNFHSFGSVPKGIYNLLDYVIVFKTNDNLKNVTDRFDNPNVIKAFQDAQQSDDKYFNRTVSLY